MPWVQRDQSNNISGSFANKQPGIAEEFLSNNDPGVIAFLNSPIPDSIDGWDLLSLRIAFNHENRIRALEGKAAITLAQFKTALRVIFNG